MPNFTSLPQVIILPEIIDKTVVVITGKWYDWQIMYFLLTLLLETTGQFMLTFFWKTDMGNFSPNS